MRYVVGVAMIGVTILTAIGLHALIQNRRNEVLAEDNEGNQLLTESTDNSE